MPLISEIPALNIVRQGWQEKQRKIIVVGLIRTKHTSKKTTTKNKKKSQQRLVEGNGIKHGELQHIHQSTVTKPLKFFSKRHAHIGTYNCHFRTIIPNKRIWFGILRAQDCTKSRRSALANDRGTQFSM